MPEERKPETGRSRESMANILIVAIGVSLVCSVFVSSAAVLLKPLQEQNRLEYRHRIVLEVAGLYEPGIDIGQRFDEEIEARLVDLETGEYVETIPPREFDHVDAASEPDTGVEIPEEADIAGIRRRAIYAPVYLIRDGDELEQVILPVYGKGLWSTMYGYLSLEPDGVTIHGLRFYEHAETPGLGDQIEAEVWLDKWSGKQLFDETGKPAVEVVIGQAQPGERYMYRVDGLSGATLTARGVTNLLRYWTGPHAFGPYLERIAREYPDG